MTTRTVYVVKTKNGYLSGRRFSREDYETHTYENVPFTEARVYTRKQDAQAACTKKTDEVIGCAMMQAVPR